MEKNEISIRWQKFHLEKLCFMWFSLDNGGRGEIATEMLEKQLIIIKLPSRMISLDNWRGLLFCRMECTNFNRVVCDWAEFLGTTEKISFASMVLTSSSSFSARTLCNFQLPLKMLKILKATFSEIIVPQAIYIRISRDAIKVQPFLECPVPLPGSSLIWVFQCHRLHVSSLQFMIFTGSNNLSKMAMWSFLSPS